MHFKPKCQDPEWQALFGVGMSITDGPCPSGFRTWRLIEQALHDSWCRCSVRAKVIWIRALVVRIVLAEIFVQRWGVSYCLRWKPE